MEMIPCGGFGIGNGLSVEKDEFGRPVLNASGSGLDLFVVNILDSDEAESGYVADKTYQEIQGAIDDGKIVVLVYDDIYHYQYIYEDGVAYHGFTRFVMQDTYAGGFDGNLAIWNEGYLISPNDIITEHYKGFSVQATALD